MPTIEQLIEQGERVREEKNWNEALKFFDNAIIVAANEKKPEQIINILGHKLIIFKHLFYETENPIFLELFKGEVLSGMNLTERFKILGQPRALMLVRMGDYNLLKKQYAGSIEYYKKSIENLDVAKKGEYGEYLGHLGFGQVLSGDNQGFNTLEKAYRLVEESNDLRPFHKLIVLAGIKLREAKSFAVIGDKAKAKESLDKAQSLGKELSKEHGLPLRLEEAERLEKELEL